MLRHSSKIALILAMVFILVDFSVNNIAGAVASPVVTPATSSSVSVDVCVRFDPVVATIAAEADKRLEADKKNRPQQDATRQQIRTKLDTGVSDIRDQWDSAKGSYYAKLQSRAVTDGQKEAVKKFIAVVDSAVTKRRSDIDQARKSYRDNIDRLMHDRRTNADTGLIVFNDSIKTIVTDIHDKCLKNPDDLLLLKDQLQGQLRIIQKTYQIDIKGDDLTKTLSDLADERQNAIKKIDNNFKATEEAARLKLREVLGEGA